MLKETAISISPSLNQIFNIFLDTGTLSFAKVVPIFKSGETNLPKNYRPISLLNNVSKVLECLVFNCMTNFLKANGLLTMWQSGFREGDNTVYQLLHIYNDWASAMDKKQSVGTVFFDLHKAIDRVWYRGLLARLYQYSFQGSIHSWLTNYLSDRQQRVVLYYCICIVFILYSDRYI